MAHVVVDVIGTISMSCKQDIMSTSTAFTVDKVIMRLREQTQTRNFKQVSEVSSSETRHVSHEELGVANQRKGVDEHPNR